MPGVSGGSLRDRDLPYLVSASSAVYLGLLGILDFISNLLASASGGIRCNTCNGKVSNPIADAKPGLLISDAPLVSGIHLPLPQDDDILVPLDPFESHSDTVRRRLLFNG